MDNRILNKLKGKILAIKFLLREQIECHMFKLIDFDDNLLKFEGWMGGIIYLPIHQVYSLEIADGEDLKKFLRYKEEYKKDKNFEGDYKLDEQDRGFKIIKRLKNNGHIN